MRLAGLWVVVGLLGLATACALAPDSGDLHVTLDPDGRPYEVPLREGHRSETRFVSGFQIAAGELRVLDGNALAVDPYFFADEAQSVSFGPVESAELSIVWEIGPPEDGGWEVPLGVRLDLPGRVVESWQAFEYAYGTDGGVGGLTSAFVLDEPHEPTSGDTFLSIDYESTLELFDVDNNGVDETLIFQNGYGDGGFPMTRGLDTGGQIAALVVWDPRFPWRLAVADGSPPPDVTHREDELIECIEGRRPVDSDGHCQADYTED